MFSEAATTSIEAAQGSECCNQFSCLPDQPAISLHLPCTSLLLLPMYFKVSSASTALVVRLLLLRDTYPNIVASPPVDFNVCSCFRSVRRIANTYLLKGLPSRIYFSPVTCWSMQLYGSVQVVATNRLQHVVPTLNHYQVGIHFEHKLIDDLHLILACINMLGRFVSVCVLMCKGIRTYTCYSWSNIASEFNKISHKPSPAELITANWKSQLC